MWLVKFTLALRVQGFIIVAAKMLHLDEITAGRFYAVHQDRPFFKDLISFMTSGPVMVQVLEGENASS